VQVTVGAAIGDGQSSGFSHRVARLSWIGELKTALVSVAHCIIWCVSYLRKSCVERSGVPSFSVIGRVTLQL
jgi:hypothetical protein